MRQIFKIAFDKHKNSSLIVLIISAMILLTFASQLEILALGIITKKGPDFFELFAPLKEGKLEKVDQISSGQVQARFQEIDTQHTGFITPQEVDQFLLQTKNRDIIRVGLIKSCRLKKI